MYFKYEVDELNSGRTVISILKHEFGFSRGLVKKLKSNGRVLCNGMPVFMTDIVKYGDIVEVYLDFDETSEDIAPTEMELNVLYEDNALIALDKPPGLITHPVSSNLYNTIANGLVYYFQKKGQRVRVRPVSRLDKDTSGIIVFAKNQFIQDRLTRQMLSNIYHKEYLGIVHGCPKASEGTIDLPIARVPGSTMLRMISEEGARCITHYKVIEVLKDAAVLRFVLETGRTHQIRVHCKAIGHPLIGDTLYSDIPTDLISRQALHSHFVRFIHPLSGKPVEIRSELPEDMDKLLTALRSQSVDVGSIVRNF